MSDDKIYVKVPYCLRHEAKLAGGLYDIDQKSWYITNNSLLPEFEKVYLNVPYEDKQKVKELGGLWCSDMKKWYTLQFNRSLINSL